MQPRTIVTINNNGVIEFISLYVHLFGSEKHIKFPVVNGKVQNVSFYCKMYGRQLIEEYVIYAQEKIDTETFDEIN